MTSQCDLTRLLGNLATRPTPVVRNTRGGSVRSGSTGVRSILNVAREDSFKNKNDSSTASLVAREDSFENKNDSSTASFVIGNKTKSIDKPAAIYHKNQGDSMLGLEECFNSILVSCKDVFKHKNESLNVLEASASQREDFSRSGTYVEIED